MRGRKLTQIPLVDNKVQSLWIKINPQYGDGTRKKLRF